MAKKKVERRGRLTAVEEIEKAIGTGATLPLGHLPVPASEKALLQGKDAMALLRECAPYAANYLLNCILGRKFKPSWARIDVCKYVLDQVLGKAKIRAELTGAGGAPLTWQGVLALFVQPEDVGRLAREGKPLPELPPPLDGSAQPPDTPESEEVSEA